MKELKITTDPRVTDKFKTYPKKIASKLMYLRSLIVETAAESETITAIEETTKWAEPSYLVKKGSTIRIDWKPKNPNQYAIYFKCTSLLVRTFREVYGDTFTYEKNRAIVFDLEQEVPKTELKTCISAALNYHSLKHVPSLGLK